MGLSSSIEEYVHRLPLNQYTGLEKAIDYGKGAVFKLTGSDLISDYCIPGLETKRCPFHKIKDLGGCEEKRGSDGGCKNAELCKLCATHQKKILKDEGEYTSPRMVELSFRIKNGVSDSFLETVESFNEKHNIALF